MRLTAVLQGARRQVMSSKRGNKNYYKGRRCNPTGFNTKNGRYKIDPYRVVRYVVPDLEGFELRPYVSYAGAGPQKIPAVGVPPMTPEELLAGAAAADSKLHAKTETDQVDMPADQTSPDSFFGRLFGFVKGKNDDGGKA